MPFQVLLRDGGVALRWGDMDGNSKDRIMYKDWTGDKLGSQPFLSRIYIDLSQAWLFKA